MIEDVAAQIAHCTLRYVNHNSRIGVGGDRADKIECRDAQDSKNERSEIGRRLRKHRNDVVVNQVADEQSTLNARENADDDTDKYDYQVNLEIFENKTEQSLERLFGVFDLRSGSCISSSSVSHWSCHIIFLPSCQSRRCPRSGRYRFRGKSGSSPSARRENRRR